MTLIRHIDKDKAVSIINRIVEAFNNSTFEQRKQIFEDYRLVNEEHLVNYFYSAMVYLQDKGKNKILAEVCTRGIKLSVGKRYCYIHEVTEEQCGEFIALFTRAVLS